MTDAVEKILGAHDVSRETSERLHAFVALLNKWNPAINLVSKSTLPNVWSRHIVDSLQVFRLATGAKSWADLGTGGGFPGLVAAIVAIEESPGAKFTLVESDQRKSAFLRTAVRETGANAQVLAVRIEQASPQNADIVSARALADISELLEYTQRHLHPDGTALLQKGAKWQKEIETARDQWQFDLEPITSVTEPEAVILKIRNIARV